MRDEDRHRASSRKCMRQLRTRASYREAERERDAERKRIARASMANVPIHEAFADAGAPQNVDAFLRAYAKANPREREHQRQPSRAEHRAAKLLAKATSALEWNGHGFVSVPKSPTAPPTMPRLDAWRRRRRQSS